MNKKGMTIIEILVVVAVIAILSVGLSAYIFQQMKNQKQAEIQRMNNDMVNTTIQAAVHQDAVLATEALEVTPDPNAPTPAPTVWMYNQANP